MQRLAATEADVATVEPWPTNGVNQLAAVARGSVPRRRWLRSLRGRM